MPFSSHHRGRAGQLGVSFTAFEGWWMDRVGIRENRKKSVAAASFSREILRFYTRDKQPRLALGTNRAVSELSFRFVLFFWGDWDRARAGCGPAGECDLPVLPEYLVNQASDKVRHMQVAEAHQQGVPLWHIELNAWESVKQKLQQLVRMQVQWGSLWDIYEVPTTY